MPQIKPPKLLTRQELERLYLENQHQLRFLEGLIKSMPAAIAVLRGPGHRYTLANSAYYQLLGVKDELLGRTVAETWPEMSHIIIPLLDQAYQTGKPHHAAGMPPGVDRDDSLAGIFFIVNPLRLEGEQGRPEAAILMAVDLPEQVKTRQSVPKLVEGEKDRLLNAVRQQREELRQLASRLAELQEAERQQLARELHDRVGRDLTALDFNLNLVQAQIGDELPGAAAIRSRLEDALALLESTAQQIRDVMADLRPSVLDDYGLAAALDWYAAEFEKRTGLEVRIQSAEFIPRLASPIETALFRITQEALTNTARHARTTKVSISIDLLDHGLCLTIADEGVGFDPARLTNPLEKQSWGLLTMMERARAIGGRCRIESHAGQGTQVIVEIPIRAGAEFE